MTTTKCTCSITYQLGIEAPAGSDDDYHLYCNCDNHYQLRPILSVVLCYIVGPESPQMSGEATAGVALQGLEGSSVQGEVAVCKEAREQCARRTEDERMTG